MENFTGAKKNRARKHFFQDSHKWDAHLLCYFINSMSTQACNTALYSNNNNNDNDNNDTNGNFIYVVEFTIVNLATYRKFTNAAWDWIIKKTNKQTNKKRKKERKKKEKKRNPNCIKSGLSQTIQVRLVISALLTMANFRCTVTLRDCLVTLSILFSVFPFCWFYVENNFY